MKSFLLVPQPLTVGNLVTNGDFASDTSSWAGYNCSIASIAGGKSGNCVQLTRTDETQQACYQEVSIITGKKYLLSGWVKSGTSGNENCSLNIADSSWTWSEGIGGISSADWTFLSLEFNVGILDGAATVTLWKVSSTAGTMLFDEISLTNIR